MTLSNLYFTIILSLKSYSTVTSNVVAIRAPEHGHKLNNESQVMSSMQDQSGKLQWTPLQSWPVIFSQGEGKNHPAADPMFVLRIYP